MSEPLGTNDIEDIVSSVRRLVSPEARPRPVSRDLGLDRLLLTPSLRVVPEPLILSTRAAELEDEPQIDLAEAPMHVVEGEWEDAFWSEPEPALAELALEAEEAVIVPAGPVVASAAPVDPVAAPAEPEVSADPLDPQGRDPEPWARDDADWLQADRGAETDSVVPFPQPAQPQPRSSSAVDSLAGLTDADGNPVTVLDETALNDIVRKLIREELQGALGERITSNVRKLVRAEINRALTARSLD